MQKPYFEHLKPAFEGVRPSTEEEIAATEAITGPLPASLRECLLTFGEFAFKDAAEIRESPAGKLSVLVFFGATGDGGILEYHDDFDDLAVQGLVPFARNELGDIFLFDRGDGSIWFADYAYDAGLTRIADDFDAFMEMFEVAR